MARGSSLLTSILIAAAAATAAVFAWRIWKQRQADALDRELPELDVEAKRLPSPLPPPVTKAQPSTGSKKAVSPNPFQRATVIAGRDIPFR